VHQIEELWMKLIAYTLLDIDQYLQQENTNRGNHAVPARAHGTKADERAVALLETMSPKEYQEIRSGWGMEAAGVARGFRRVAQDVTSRSGIHSRTNYLDKHG